MAVVKPSRVEVENPSLTHKIAEPKAPEVEAPEPKALGLIRTQGAIEFMLNPYTGQTFMSEPVKVDTVDSWTQSQIDAGKLVQC